MHPELTAVLARLHSDEFLRHATEMADIRRFEAAAESRPRRSLTAASVLKRYFRRGEQAHEQRLRRPRPGAHGA